MIRSLYGSLVGDFFYMRNNILRYPEIIQSPSDIPWSRSRSERSPGILIFQLRIEMPENIYISLIFQLIHF